MKYRSDIDGLRAIAIATVLLDHLDVPGFSGGFVGVDIFFVISGFLITTLITEAEAAGRFGFAAFYERRIRRIFPALFVVLIATLAAGWMLTTPADFEDLGKAAAAAAVSGANFFFWSTSGYFAPDAERLALLHTWSLAVEEQFYLLFPALMAGLAAARLPRRAVLAGLALASFAWSVATSAYWPNAAFYLLPARAGELLLGALVSLSPPPRLEARGRLTVAFLGLVLIAVAVAVIDPADPFPSWRALVPCLGTAMVIHAGRAGPTAVGELLSIAPMRFLGAISYSLYLWHWPVVVFARYRFFDELDAVSTLALALLSIALATLSWRFVERPFRHAPDPAGSRRVVATGLALAVVVALLGVGVFAARGVPGRMNPQIREIADPDWGRYRRCLEGAGVAEAKAGTLCRLGSAGAEPTFLLVGDSFAAALADGIDHAASAAGTAGFFVGVHSCPPIEGLASRASSAASRAACTKMRAALPEIIAITGIRRVLVHSLWANFDSELGRRRLLAGTGIDPLSPAADTRLRAAVESTVERLAAAGVEIVVIGPIPAARKNVPATLARARLSGRDTDLGKRPQEFRADNRTATAIFTDLAGRGRLRWLEPAEALCDTAICRVEIGGLPLYADGYHLNRRGSDLVAARLWPQIGSPP